MGSNRWERWMHTITVLVWMPFWGPALFVGLCWGWISEGFRRGIEAARSAIELAGDES